MHKIGLNSHFGYKTILLQCLPPILMMIFTSLYTVIDGLFISNFAGADAFAGMNLIAPITMIVGGIGFMFGSGGSALASKLLGEGKNKDADKVFTMMLVFSTIIVILVSIILLPNIDKISRELAKLASDTTEKTIQNATIYGQVLLIGQFIFSLQSIFQNFFVVNETPHAGLIQTLIAGITNIIFDTVFIVGCNMGVLGAAIGTIFGYIGGTVFSFLYILLRKKNLLHLCFSKPSLKVLEKTSVNGLSDFIFNISSAVVSLIYNIQLLKYFGQNGVNAFGAVMYINFIFVAIFIGISIGTAPIIGYNYGARNDDELHNVIFKTLNIVFIASVLMTVIAEVSAPLLANAFSKEPTVNALTVKAIRYYSPSFLFAGFCIFITSMFTGLNDGVTSGILSFVRTLVLQIIFLLVFPIWFGGDSLWWLIILVEGLSFILAFVYFYTKRKKYHY